MLRASLEVTIMLSVAGSLLLHFYRWKTLTDSFDQKLSSVHAAVVQPGSATQVN